MVVVIIACNCVRGIQVSIHGYAKRLARPALPFAPTPVVCTCAGADFCPLCLHVVPGQLRVCLAYLSLSIFLCSVTVAVQIDLVKHTNLDDADITRLMNRGLLLHRDTKSYWTAIPNAGPVIRWLRKGREEVMRMLKRAKYKYVRHIRIYLLLYCTLPHARPIASPTRCCEAVPCHIASPARCCEACPCAGTSSLRIGMVTRLAHCAVHRCSVTAVPTVSVRPCFDPLVLPAAVLGSFPRWVQDCTCCDYYC